MIIYLYTNTINGKRYVGQTQREDKERISEHLRKNKTVFDKAVSKYGMDAFKYEVIDTAETTKELNEKERYWIKKLKTKHPNGYNLTDGGNTTRGYHHTKEAREKMSRTKKKMNYNVGSKNNFYGKHHTAETRQKMKAAWTDERKAKQIPNLVKHHYKRPVINVTTGKKFNSIKEAGEYYGIAPTHITRVLKGKRKTTGGYKWEYILNHDNTEPSPNE